MFSFRVILLEMLLWDLFPYGFVGKDLVFAYQ
jgi:hypothetical protein